MKSKPVQFITKYLPIIIFVFSFLYYSTGIRSTSIFFYDEARNSGCAREMAERGDLIVPTFNYELRTDKPPLHYYFMMVSYSLFGVNEFSSRFFSAVAGALTILLSFLFTRKYMGYKTAVYTVLILLASLNLTLEFHLAVPDPYLISLMTSAFISFFTFYKSGKKTSLLLMYFTAGLAVLAKGPVAIGLIGLIGLIFLLIKKEFTWQTVKKFRIDLGILIVLLINVPWYYLVGKATEGRWLREFFLEQNLSRMTSEMEGHGGFFGLIVIFVFLAFLPFSVFIIQSFRKALTERKDNDLILYSAVISFVVVLFFSFSSTKLPNYPMPAYPFIAIIIGYFLSAEKIKNLKMLLIINLLISLAIFSGVFFLMKSMRDLSSLTNISFILLIPVLGSIISLVIWIQSRNLPNVIISLSLTWIITSSVIFLRIFPSLSKEDPVYTVLPLIDETKPFAYYRRFNSAFPFYIRKPIRKLQTIDETKEFLNENPEGYIISATQFEEELKNLPLQEIFRKGDLFEPPVTIVLKMRE